MKKTGIVIAIAAMLVALSVLVLPGCAAQTNSPAERQTAASQTTSSQTAPTSASRTESAAPADTTEGELEDTMKLLIGEKEVPVTWEENASVEALKALSPVTIQMSMYGGFEQVGPIGRSIVRNDVQTNTNYGDIVLYSGNQIAIFYGSNSWAYTRLGHIALTQKEMSDLLGNGDVTITLE